MELTFEMKCYLKVKSFLRQKMNQNKTLCLVLNFPFLSFDKKCFVSSVQFAALVTEPYSSMDFLVKMPRYSHEIA